MLQQHQNCGRLRPPVTWSGGGTVVVDSLLIVSPLCDSVIVLCFAERYFVSILVLLSS